MKKKSSYDKMEVLNEAFCDGQLTSTDKAVFQRLVWRLNLKTGACFPSVGLVAKELSMTERGVRKCTARLERQGYLKRQIHRGRTKANDYLIPGLNTERRFQKSGTLVPKKKNGGSAQIVKEREKEKEASEERVSDIDVSSSGRGKQRIQVSEGHFQNRLVDALGGGERGWSVLMRMSSERLEVLRDRFANGSMSFQEAVETVRIEFINLSRDSSP